MGTKATHRSAMAAGVVREGGLPGAGGGCELGVHRGGEHLNQ